MDELAAWFSVSNGKPRMGACVFMLQCYSRDTCSRTSEVSMHSTFRAEFDDLRQQAREALAAGDLPRALELSDRALGCARTGGDRDDVDLAECNRAAVLMQSDRVAEATSVLRRLLLASGSARTRHLAAYNVSLHHHRLEDWERSRFYAGLALDHAEQAEDAALVGRSHNRIANICLADSDFPGAVHHYEEALERLGDASESERAVLLANIGYCRLTQERFEDGFHALFRAWRSFRRHGVRWGVMEGRVRLALSYGYLEIERSDRAIAHGRAALAAGEAVGDTDLVKKSLYLLGESLKQAGDDAEAADVFTRLHAEYYPGHAQLVDILMNTSTHRMINLWA